MNDANSGDPVPRWMRVTLVLAGIYNLVWGSLVILFPNLIFRWAGMDLPKYPQIWQCVGMIVGVYGVGYLIAASDPLRHWPITLVGLLGKIFGPIGFLSAALDGSLPWSWGATILTNDAIWWVPFGMIVYRAYRQHRGSNFQGDSKRDFAAGRDAATPRVTRLGPDRASSSSY